MTEIEVKIKVDDFQEIEEIIKKLQISGINDWEFEDNIIFDFPDKRLKKGGKLFRLRKTDKISYITFKTPSKEGDKNFKIREEFEVNVSNVAKMKKIISLLGLNKYFRYQKKRKTYIINQTHICLDKTPIGNFIEIEGDKESIKEIAKLFGKTEKDFIIKSYYSLFREKHKKGDMVFSK